MLTEVLSLVCSGGGVGMLLRGVEVPLELENDLGAAASRDLVELDEGRAADELGQRTKPNEQGQGWRRGGEGRL